jgi:hypothetical protein
LRTILARALVDSPSAIATRVGLQFIREAGIRALTAIEGPALTSPEGIMEMQRLSGGSLRAAGYDMRARKLVIELTSGTYEYQSVPSEVWRRFSDASSPWSYFRDNIEEEYTAKRLR